MERKIGEIFENNGEWYQCVKGNCCRNCDFYDKFKDDICFSINNCSLSHRNDKTSVIFKRLKKVGEPIRLDGKWVQRVLTPSKYSCDGCCFDQIDECDKPDNGLCCEHEIYVEVKQNKENMEEKNEVQGNDVLSKEEWRMIEKAQEDWKRNFPSIPLISSMSVDAFFPHIIKLGLLNKYKELSNSESIEKNLKPFNLQKAKDGKPVCTRDGRKARIICFDSNGGRPIVALVTECDDEEEIPYKYHCDGSYNCQSIPSDNDLMMLSEKRKGWVNVYKDDDSYTTSEEIYESKEEAIKSNPYEEAYLTTVKIEWEE